MHTLSDLSSCLAWPCAQFEKYKTAISSYPLIERVSKNWKTALMDTATVIATTLFVITFFTSSPLWWGSLAIVAIASIFSSFYIRKLDLLADLEDTAKGLKETKEHLQKIATDLQTENNRLRMTNDELQRTSMALQNTNRELQRTNENLQTTSNRLSGQVGELTSHVTQLNLQITHLKESSEKIKEEVIRFADHNTALGVKVEGFNESLSFLDREVQTSRILCEQVSQFLTTHERDLGTQMQQLQQHLCDLRADNRVLDQIRQLDELRRQTLEVNGQLRDVQVKYAGERGKFEALHTALTALKDQFDTSMKSSLNNFQSNNSELRENIDKLKELFNRTASPVGG